MLQQQVAHIYEGRVCGEKQQKKCQAEFGEHLEWTCRKCEKDGKKVRAAEISEYTHYILWLITLQRAGYPFAQDDLPLAVWEHLGLAADTIGTIREARAMQAGVAKRMI